MYDYFTSCVDVSGDEVSTLQDMVDRSLQITRATFLGYVNRDDLRSLERALGYADHHARGLTMAGDYMVSYHRSTWGAARCYYFCHSGIEYIFLER